MRRSATTLTEGGHSGLPTEAAPANTSLLCRSTRPCFQRSGTGSGSRGGKVRGAHLHSLIRPAASPLTLPTLSPEIPFRLEDRQDFSGPRIADLAEALIRERVLGPRHWKPGMDLLQSITDAVGEWAHRRQRLTGHPINHLDGISLCVAADIEGLEELMESRVCGLRALGLPSESDLPLAALALTIQPDHQRGGALKPWATFLESQHGIAIASSFTGIMNTAVDLISGWGPAFAQMRVELAENNDVEEGITKEQFDEQIPCTAWNTDYRRKDFVKLSEEKGLVGGMGSALLNLCDAVRRPRSHSYMRHGKRRWYCSDYSGDFGEGFPYPPLIFTWSDDVVEGGGFDFVTRTFDDEMECLYNSECSFQPWLYPFVPTAEGNGEGTLRFALECLERVLRVIRALDDLIDYLNRDPVQVTDLRVRVHV